MNAPETLPLPPALSAGLVYADDSRPGYRRRRVNAKTFHYFDTHGKRITDPAKVQRIQSLAIPPAYTDVWICPDPQGHIQATGRDARGRKQYRYHADWTQVRDAQKYGQLAEFGLCLPRIRARIERDMALPGLPRDKVAATLVRLLELTRIRIGSREYARANQSFGLTTLTRRHAQVAGDRIRLRFVGKSGVPHDVTVADRRIARLVRRCLDLPGQQLFHYLDESGEPRAVDSDLVNDYLREASGADFTAKHYRTWAGTLYAYAALRMQIAQVEGEERSVTALRKQLTEVIKRVAQRLANTPAVCRSCYIHPAVMEAYLEGTLAADARAPDTPRGLAAEERRLLAFLQALQTAATA
ncbi:DNA topoisomerase IB [Bordetella genomosp. 13]|uniref:DNA topoisomerase IB n=1 Tax=Bordetella genomosp. 13 TaxID=463040 RepID=UPI001C92F4F5|nr:DNA topoisomerase IB [Bordetella genomosp. 13]